MSSSGVQSQRVIFIDLGRALAVTFMLYGHTASALLAPEYQAGRWFEIWQFQRGLTSSLFLLLASLEFRMATSRPWASHVAVAVAVAQTPRRVRRHVEEHDPGYPYLWDANGAAVRAYHAPTTSVVVMLNAQGKGAYSGVGPNQHLTAEVEKLLGSS